MFLPIGDEACEWKTEEKANVVNRAGNGQLPTILARYIPLEY